MKTKKATDNSFFLIMEIGDDINQELEALARKEKITSATITGIGAIEEVTLGYFDKAQKKYNNKIFSGDFELISCEGNISWLSDKPIVHLHATIANNTFEVFAGHLFSSKISLTGEFFLQTTPAQLERKFNPHLNLNIIE